MAEETTAVAGPLMESSPPISPSRQAWRRVGQRLKGITPSMLARGVLIIGILAILGWLAVATWPALAPFLLGAAIAYVLLPVVDWLDRFLPRALAVLLTLAVVLALLAAFLAQFFPLIGEQVTYVYTNIPSPEELALVEEELIEELATLPAPVRSTVERMLVQGVDTVQSNLDNYIINLVNSGFAGLITLINTIGFILGFLVIPAWLLDVLRDQKTGTERVDQLLPEWLRLDFWAVVRIVDRPFRAFVQGQFVLAIAAALGVYAGLVLLETLELLEPVRYKALIAALVGLFQLIPTLGPILAGVALVLLGLIRSPQTAVIALLLHLGVQQLVNLYVAPRVERRYVDIHPALLVMAIVALSEFGILWVIVAAPITAVLRDLFRYVYGRVSDPPQPAGVLPGLVTPILPPSRLFAPFVPADQRQPLAYRRHTEPRNPAMRRTRTVKSQPE